jgi:hypothetical protein
MVPSSVLEHRRDSPVGQALDSLRHDITVPRSINHDDEKLARVGFDRVHSPIQGTTVEDRSTRCFAAGRIHQNNGDIRREPLSSNPGEGR